MFTPRERTALLTKSQPSTSTGSDRKLLVMKLLSTFGVRTDVTLQIFCCRESVASFVICGCSTSATSVEAIMWGVMGSLVRVFIVLEKCFLLKEKKKKSSCRSLSCNEGKSSQRRERDAGESKASSKFVARADEWHGNE